MPVRLPPTEQNHPQSSGLDLLETRALVETIAMDQRAAVDAVIAQAQAIAGVVDRIVERLRRGGAVHYIGAGSSGRLAVLDAAEIPPTFGTDPHLVCAHVAGGTAALLRAVEGAEDDAASGAAAIEQHVRPQDVTIGISASGAAAYVVAAIERARRERSYTVALTSVIGSPLVQAAESSIVLDTGPEVLAGSTRLKAGTAQKIALNAISTAVMVRLGKVYDNLMVDVVAGNRKLRERAVRLVCTIAQVDEQPARELLARANGRVKVAILMHCRGLDRLGAEALLDRHGGSLRAAL
jgi:N-acetylmuramic acid 6-phosphate etherase